MLCRPHLARPLNSRIMQNALVGCDPLTAETLASDAVQNYIAAFQRNWRMATLTHVRHLRR